MSDSSGAGEFISFKHICSAQLNDSLGRISFLRKTRKVNAPVALATSA